MTEATEVSPGNPFSDHDRDRREIWEILMRHDFEAFAAGDWSMVGQDFWEVGFCGIDARKEVEPSKWRLAFPNVATYRDEWLRQVREVAPVRLVGTSILQFLYDSCVLDEIEIVGDRAIARKMFDGEAVTTSGSQIVLRFQTLYQMTKQNDGWKIAGFVGYLPNPMLVGVNPCGASTPW